MLESLGYDAPWDVASNELAFDVDGLAVLSHGDSKWRIDVGLRSWTRDAMSIDGDVYAPHGWSITASKCAPDILVLETGGPLSHLTLKRR